MNTHDIDTELPPLPYPYDTPAYRTVGAVIQEYALAAIEAALQSQDREDALRYRWLRNRASDDGICVVHIDYWSDEYRGQARCEVYGGEFLDKAIDDARRIEGDGE